MSPVEWFYSQEKKRFGPVSPTELKALADAGKLQPDDLVWREGMDSWVPARRVKGLFEAESQNPAATSVPGTEAAEASPTSPEPPVMLAAPPMSFSAQTAGSERGGRGFENSLAAFYRAREGISVHLFDFILDLMRRALPAPLVEAACQTFSVVGYYALYGAMALFFMAMLFLSMEAKQASLLGWAAAGVLVFGVLQYTAGRFLPALDRLNKSSPSRLCSTAFLDCLALLLLALGAAGVLSQVVYAVQQNQYLMIFSAVELFIVVELAALIAVAPETVQMTVSPETRAGEEALSVWTFLLKLLLKLTPVLFCLGVLHGVVELLFAFVLLASKKGSEAPLILWESFVYITVAAALPLITYLLFLTWYLAIDLMQAILETPRLLRKNLGPSEQPPSEEG